MTSDPTRTSTGPLTITTVVKFTRDEDRVILQACRTAAAGMRDSAFWEALSGQGPGQVDKAPPLLEERFRFLSQLFKRKKQQQQQQENQNQNQQEQQQEEEEQQRQQQLSSAIASVVQV